MDVAIDNSPDGNPLQMWPAVLLSALPGRNNGRAHPCGAQGPDRLGDRRRSEMSFDVAVPES